MAEPIKVKLLDAQKNPILPETTADQVKTADGSNVDAKIKALEAAFASGVRPCGTVGTGGTVEALPSAADGNLMAFDGTSGTVAKDSGVALSDVSDAVTKRHQHANVALLDGISADGETVTINGKTYYSGRMVAVIEAGGEIPADMNSAGIVFEKVAAGPAA